MLEPKPQSVPAAAATAASSSSTLSLEELKNRIPLLQKMKEDDPRFGTLIHLLQEVSSKPYDSSQKYQLMFKIIEIGNLFEILCSHIKNPKPTDIANTCVNGVMLDSFKPEQQLALFQLARNVSADYFHAMYEDKTKEFFEAFSLLCKGQCTSTKLLEVDDIFQKLSRGSDLKKVLGNPDEGKNRINKLFCQIGYFIKKADEFLKAGNYEAAAMALIAAGNAGRNFNFSGLNPVKRGSVTAKLYELRSIYAHIHSDDNKNKFSLSERLMKFIEHGEIARLIGAINEEAAKMNNPVDIDAYYAKRESSGASPRTYDSALLREPSSIASNAAVASSSSQTSSAKVSRESHDIGSRPPESKNREEQVHDDKERHVSSPSSSTPTSSSSSQRQGYDARQKDRERDRDSDRGRGDERDSRRSDDRKYSSPPRSSYGSSSSSSSRHSERERYDVSRPSSSIRAEPLDRSRQSQSSRAADEDEERRRAHDTKRAKGSSETGCKDEALRYSKKDDSDDESRRHEKRHQPPQPSLGSGVSSSSTQRSTTHSEKSSSSSYTGSSSHSDVRHESSSLSAHYGSSLGKPKDWHRVESEHDPQPEKPIVKDSSQQVQAKRERPRTEEETPREKQNAGLKRRF